MIKLTFLKEFIDVNETSESKKCNICLIFLIFNQFEFQPNIFNRGHDLLMMSMNLSNIAISNIKSANYCWIISGVTPKVRL